MRGSLPKLLVKTHPDEGERVGLFEKHPDHPTTDDFPEGGECYVAGQDQEPQLVAATPRVVEALEAGRLVMIGTPTPVDLAAYQRLAIRARADREIAAHAAARRLAAEAPAPAPVAPAAVLTLLRYGRALEASYAALRRLPFDDAVPEGSPAAELWVSATDPIPIPRPPPRVEAPPPPHAAPAPPPPPAPAPPPPWPSWRHDWRGWRWARDRAVRACGPVRAVPSELDGWDENLSARADVRGAVARAGRGLPSAAWSTVSAVWDGIASDATLQRTPDPPETPPPVGWLTTADLDRELGLQTGTVYTSYVNGRWPPMHRYRHNIYVEPDPVRAHFRRRVAAF